MNNNGFGLSQSILSLLIILLAVTLLANCVQSIWKQKDMVLDETINKEWFYSD